MTPQGGPGAFSRSYAQSGVSCGFQTPGNLYRGLRVLFNIANEDLSHRFTTFKDAPGKYQHFCEFQERVPGLLAISFTWRFLVLEWTVCYTQPRLEFMCIDIPPVPS